MLTTNEFGDCGFHRFTHLPTNEFVGYGDIPTFIVHTNKFVGSDDPLIARLGANEFAPHQTHRQNIRVFHPTRDFNHGNHHTIQYHPVPVPHDFSRGSINPNRQSISISTHEFIRGSKETKC